MPACRQAGNPQKIICAWCTAARGDFISILLKILNGKISEAKNFLKKDLPNLGFFLSIKNCAIPGHYLNDL
jgi:hypothetical protein